MVYKNLAGFIYISHRPRIFCNRGH